MSGFEIDDLYFLSKQLDSTMNEAERGGVGRLKTEKVWNSYMV